MRWGRRVLWFGLLGLGTTVGLAWACAILVNVRGDPYGPSPRPARHGWRMILPHEQRASGYTDRAMSLVRMDHFGSTYFHVEVLTAAGTGGMPAGTATPEDVAGPLLERVALPWTYGLLEWPPNDDRAYFNVRGWPVRALWCRYNHRYTPGNSMVGDCAVTGGIRVPINDPKSVWYAPPLAPTALPYRPIWTGLAADTVFFGAVWWVGLTGVRWVRVRGRVRKGLCASCGYPRRGLETMSPCPECGAVSGAAPIGPLRPECGDRRG